MVERKKRITLIFVLLLMSFACRFSRDVSPDVFPIEPLSISAVDSAPEVHRSAAYAVKVDAGVEYARGLSHEDWGSESYTEMPLLLNVYHPFDAPANRPAMILIHGGAFRLGDRRSTPIVELAEYFASRGWVVLSIDYRLEDDRGTVPEVWMEMSEGFARTEDAYNQILAMYPAGRDAKAAVRWLYAHAVEYAVNPDYITVGGGSAGAFLSIMLGVTGDGDYLEEISESEDPTLVSTNLDQPMKVHTIIDFWGGDGSVTALQSVDGVDRFDEQDAPILILHGDEDRVVDFDEAENLQSVYEQTGVAYAFYPLVGEGHSAWDAQVDGMSLAELAFEFIVSQQGLQVDE